MGETFYKEMCVDGFVGDSLYGGSFFFNVSIFIDFFYAVKLY